MADIKSAAKTCAHEAEETLLPLLDQVERAVSAEKEQITGGLERGLIVDNNLINAAKEYHAIREAVEALNSIAESGFGNMTAFGVADLLNYTYTHSGKDQTVTPVYAFVLEYEADLLKAAHRIANEHEGEGFGASLKAERWLKHHILDYDTRAKAAGITVLGRVD